MSRKLLFLFIIFAALGIITAKFIFSFFNDTASSPSNTFAAAAQFPTPIPTTTPTAGPTSTPGITPTPGINAGDVVINEINWSSAADEWIELRNTTSHPIDISNWVILNGGTGGSSVTINSFTIPANGLFLMSNKDKSQSDINIDPDEVDSGISFVDSGEQLTLQTNTATTIDIANGMGDWFCGTNNAPKKSMERKDSPGDGTVGSNWQHATTHTNMDNNGTNDPYGTPKAVNGS